MASGRAHDPLHHGISIETYNRAREIAIEVLSADRRADITNGAIRWSDAFYPQGEDPQWETVTMYNGGNAPICTNCPYYERTHFDNDYYTDNGNWCVTTVPATSCR